MTAKRKRLDALEAQARGRTGRAWLEGLSDQELDAVHVATLRRDGHPDPEGEAARTRTAVDAMPEEDLRAWLATLEGARP
jgi:hypothetical protein